MVVLKDIPKSPSLSIPKTLPMTESYRGARPDTNPVIGAEAGQALLVV